MVVGAREAGTIGRRPPGRPNRRRTFRFSLSSKIKFRRWRPSLQNRSQPEVRSLTRRRSRCSSSTTGKARARPVAGASAKGLTEIRPKRATGTRTRPRRVIGGDAVAGAVTTRPAGREKTDNLKLVSREEEEDHRIESIQGLKWTNFKNCSSTPATERNSPIRVLVCWIEQNSRKMSPLCVLFEFYNIRY